MLKNTVETLFIILQVILPKHFLSRVIAKFADSEIPWLKNALINLAIDVFNINMEEAASTNLNDYVNFNAFFTRELKPKSRPFSNRKKDFISPCDGKLSQFGTIEAGKLIQAKGKYFELKQLLGGDEKLTSIFEEGEFATIYLSPRDYHRVHMPCHGTLLKSIYVPGELFSVNQSTAENIDGLFARNERLICLFDTEQGPMISIMVGAMLVAGIETVWQGQVVPPKIALTTYEKQAADNVKLSKSAEMGRFKFGSTVILLLPKKTINWKDNFQIGEDVRLGQTIANYLK